MKPQHELRGIALIEALVALTLLAASLAATAALVVQTIRHTRDAADRSKAIRIASSLAEDLRALRCPDGRALRSVGELPPEAACEAHPACCAVEQAAAVRYAAWQAELATATLPGAAGRVDTPDPSIAAYRIRIEWQVAGSSGAAFITLPVES